MNMLASTRDLEDDELDFLILQEFSDFYLDPESDKASRENFVPFSKSCMGIAKVVPQVVEFFQQLCNSCYFWSPIPRISMRNMGICKDDEQFYILPGALEKGTCKQDTQNFIKCVVQKLLEKPAQLKRAGYYDWFTKDIMLKNYYLEPQKEEEELYIEITEYSEEEESQRRKRERVEEQQEVISVKRQVIFEPFPEEPWVYGYEISDIVEQVFAKPYCETDRFENIKNLFF